MSLGLVFRGIEGLAHEQARRRLKPNWERYIASGTNVRIAKAQALARKEALEEAINAASM